MARVGLLACGLILMGWNCSRERVESMNHMNAGVEAAQMRRYSEAIKELERATALDPTNDQAFHNLAIVHMELRAFSAAKDALTKASAAKPDVAEYQEKLGTVQMELEDWKGAKTALEKATALDDSLFKAYYKLGRVSEELEDEHSALEFYTQAASKGGRFLPAYAALGRLYADLRYPDEAIHVLKEGLKASLEPNEDEATLHLLLGTVYQQQRNYDQAVAELQTALGIAPAMVDALFSLGWTYSLQQNFEEAKRYLTKYLTLASSNAPAHYVKAARDRIAEIEALEKAEVPATE